MTTKQNKTEAHKYALVRDLVMHHGWNPSSYQLLNPGIEHWFSKRHEAVIGYVSTSSVWLAAGSPVCADDVLGDVAREFETVARKHHKRVCYFGAGDRLTARLGRETGYAAVIVGAQPSWQANRWESTIGEHASMRAQLKRARNKGVTVTEWSAIEAAANPALRAILAEWLRDRTLPSMHFLAESKNMGCLYDRRVFVAARHDMPIAFLVLAPVPRRNGWLTEQFVRGNRAVNGCMELLMDTAIRTIAAEGAEYATMGMVPLSRQCASFQSNPLWLDLTLRWLRAHGRRFYSFEGLESFKSKFRPHSWEPVWVLSHEAHFSPSTLWAITKAFSRQPPLRFVARGFLRAASQEFKWVHERLVQGTES